MAETTYYPSSIGLVRPGRVKKPGFYEDFKPYITGLCLWRTLHHRIGRFSIIKKG